MALKRQLSQPSPGATPARKAPRLALAVKIPSSPDPVLTGPTVVVSPDGDHPANSPFRYFRNVQPLPANALSHLDPAQLVERLEDLAEEYERSVDEMGAEIEHLKREVSFARRRLEATPSFEARDTAAPFNSTPGVRQPALSGTLEDSKVDGDEEGSSGGQGGSRSAVDAQDGPIQTPPGGSNAEPPNDEPATATEAST